MKNIINVLLSVWLITSSQIVQNGCYYEIYENDILVTKQLLESDGSMKWDISEISSTNHKYRIRYWCDDGLYSEPETYTITKSCVGETCTYSGYEKGRITLKH